MREFLHELKYSSPESQERMIESFKQKLIL